MDLVDGLPILERFTATFHDLGKLMNHFAFIEITGNVHNALTVSDAPQNNCIFDVPQNGYIGVVCCYNYLPPQFDAGEDVHYNLANQAVVEVVLPCIHLLDFDSGSDAVAENHLFPKLNN